MAGWIASAAMGGDEPASRPKPEDPPTSVYLQPPVDRENLLKWLARPDMVILDGETYARLRKAIEAATIKPIAVSVVESVAIGGEVTGDLARLVIEFRVAVAADGPTWVPFQLDGLTLAEVREAGRDLVTRLTEARGWQLELSGRGEHLIRVEAMVPVRGTPEGRKLELAIPPAASTRLEINVSGVVLTASTGVGEPVGLTAIDGGVRLSSRIGPRPKLDLSWRQPADPTAQLPALLSAKGEIVVEIESGAIKTQGTWAISAIRGATSELTIRLDPTETVLEALLDRQPIQVEARRDGARSVLAIPLGEPLRAGQTKDLVLITRRPIPIGAPTRVLFQGYPIDQGRVQVGVVAVTRNAPIFLNPVVGRGIRRIDPRTDLREALRARPDTAMAFEFNDQPFELAIDVEPAPPRLLVESRTTATIGAHSAKVETRLDGRFTQGRASEVRLILPKGLDLDEVGPPELVASLQEAPVNPQSPATGAESARMLTIFLNRQSREPDSFVIKLKGSCRVDPSKLVNLPIFRPVADRTTGCQVLVLADRNVAVELGEGGDEPSPFRVDWGPVAEGWDWPGGKRPTPETSLLRLVSDVNPDAVPLKIAVRARSIRHESTVTATFDRRGADVVDEIAGEVTFDSIGRLDVAVPPGVPERVTFDGASALLLGQDPDGTRRFRLKFPRDQAETFQIRARYRMLFAALPGPGRQAVSSIGVLKLLEGVSTAQTVRISADASLDIEASGQGWAPIVTGEPSGEPFRLAFSKVEDVAGPIAVRIAPEPQTMMPKLVASRLWIRTTLRVDNDLATSATYWIEARDGPIVVALPPGARWVRARLGRSDAGEVGVESVANDQYRLKFPGTPVGPILLTIEYEVPAGSTWAGWSGPILVDGVVQQSAWEVVVPGNRAGVGVPDGWADENEWFWDGLLWRRRPAKGFAELSLWITGGSPRHRVLETLDSGDRAGRHAYLFSRSGPPGSFRFLVVSRIWLLLTCSGPILIAGLLVMARRPGARTILIGAVVVAFAEILLVDWDTTMMVMQSSTLGITLLIAAMAMNWAIERRSVGRVAPVRPTDQGVGIPGSSIARPVTVGSDDSTAIRPRPANLSTADHVIVARSSLPLSEKPAPASGLEVR